MLRLRLVLLALLAIVVCLGRWAGLEPLVDAVPLLHKFRFPTKAFFTVHMSLALLAATGVDALQAAGPRAWRPLATALLGLGGGLVAAPELTRLAPEATRRFVAAFFPPGVDWPQRAEWLQHILSDARLGGLLAAGAGAVAALVWGRRLDPTRAAWALLALTAVDLLRAGAGLNPMVAGSFYRASPETSSMLAEAQNAGRFFVCDPQASPAYWQALRARPGAHETWTFATFIDTLTPNANLQFHVPTALSEDHTSLVPVSAAPPAGASCSAFATLLEPLRAAAVTHVLSLDPIDHPDLRLAATWVPARIRPLVLHLYRLERPWPQCFVATRVRAVPDRASALAAARAPDVQAGDTAVEAPVEPHQQAGGRVEVIAENADRLELRVWAESGGGVLVLRETWAPGWAAWVDDRPVPVWRTDGRHRAVAVPGATSRVVLRYRPPHLQMALVLFAAAVVAILALYRSGGRLESAGSGS